MGRIIAIGIGALLLVITPARAAVWDWTGGGVNNIWSNFGNWFPLFPSGPPENTGTAHIVFGATPRLTPDLNLAWNVNSLTFNNTAGMYNLISNAGNTLTVGAGGITKNGGDLQTISHAITLSAAQTWTATNPGSLRVFGATNNGGNLLMIDAADGAAMSISGAISGGGGLTKNGLGALYLDTSTNTYAGTTTVNAGFMQISGPVAIPGTLVIGDGIGTAIDTLSNGTSERITNTATVSVFSTGHWDLSTAASGTFANSETITHLNIVSSGVAGGALVTIRSVGGQDGRLTILGDLTMTGGSVATTGAGTVQLNGNLTTNASNVAATISSKLDLNLELSIFTVADGTAPIDLDVTGVVSRGAIRKEGPGTLRLSGANTYSAGTFNYGGTILIGHDAALGVGTVFGNGSATFRADGAARTIANALGGSIVLDGEFDLTLNAPANLGGEITKNGAGALIFAKAGTFDWLILNAGIARLDASLTFTNGLSNSSTLLVGTNTLNVNGAALSNHGALILDGGTLSGSGPVVSNGSVFGFGTIAGSGGFTNNSLLSVSGGSLTLANSGANLNSGNVLLPGGVQLRLTGGALANTGSIDLANGIVTGTASLINNAGGTVSGRGVISAPFVNAGGTLRAISGTLSVTNPFINSGVIRIDDAAGLSGGAITNTGRIQGDGSVLNAIINTGRIDAVGTLVLAGAVTNTGAGVISATAGNRVVFTTGLVDNAATILLGGGSFDNNGAALSNTGLISGFGDYAAGGTANAGQFAFTAGASSVRGAVNNSASGKVIVTGGGGATFYGNVSGVAGTEVRVAASSAAVFLAPVSGPITFTGTGAKYFEAGVSPVGPVASSGITIVEAPATLTSDHIRESSLTVSGRVNIRANSLTSRVEELVIQPTGTLDLANNALIVDYDGASPLAGIRAAIVSGYAGGAWNGKGIISSTASTDPGKALGYGEASAIVGPAGGVFEGLNVDGAAVLVRYTLRGDTNLDGQISFTDLLTVAANFGEAGDWSDGDFDYDGNVSFVDLLNVAAGFGQSLPVSVAVASAEFNEALAAVNVPEAGCVGLCLGVAAVMGLRRRW